MADLKHHDFLGKLEEDSLTVWESPQFKALGQRALDEGPDRVLQELLDKPQLENAEMLWLLKELTYFYGKPDDLLLKVPARRLIGVEALRLSALTSPRVLRLRRIKKRNETACPSPL